MSISLWSSDEQAWIPKPCGCCNWSVNNKYQDGRMVYCDLYDRDKYPKEFCSEWTRRLDGK